MELFGIKHPSFSLTINIAIEHGGHVNSWCSKGNRWITFSGTVSLALIKRIWKRAMKHGGHMGFMDGYGRYIYIVNGEIEWGFNQQK